MPSGGPRLYDAVRRKIDHAAFLEPPGPYFRKHASRSEIPRPVPESTHVEHDTIEGGSKVFNMDSPRKVARTGVWTIALVGVIHLVVIPEYFAEAAYVGLLFLANAVGAGISAYGIRRGVGWGWALGALISAVSFVGYIASRTVGLPGAPGILREGFFDPPGLVSLVLEALFLALYLRVLAYRGGAGRSTGFPK